MAKKKLYNANAIVYSTDSTFPTEDKAENEITLPAQEQLLKIKLDNKHRSGKSVTLVQGFSGTNEDIEHLGKQLKSYCATGGSVKNGEIIIQGDNREKIFQWLQKMDYKKTKKL